MTQRKALFEVLKQQVRAQGMTYKSLADRLDLSEASVKRIFSQKDIQLSRLEDIAACIQFSLSDLFELVEKQRERIRQLSQAQEKELISDRALLLVTICVLNSWTFSEILAYYNLSEHQLLRHCARLDQMKIIELQPGNRFKVVIDRDFHWLTDGPIQRFFQENIQTDFLNSSFIRPDELYLVRNGMLTEAENIRFQKLLYKTANEFISRCQETSSVPIEQRHGTALLIAMRPWVPKIFDEFRREF